MTTKQHIQLKLFATLKQHLPANADAYPVDPGTTVRQVVEALGIPAELAKLVFINGIKAPLDQPIRDGDRIGIFPPVGGG